jgi:hypothetical protein
MTTRPRLPSSKLLLQQSLLGLTAALVWGCGSGEAIQGFVEAGGSDGAQGGDSSLDGSHHHDTGSGHDAHAHADAHADAHDDSSVDSGHDAGPQCLAPEVECMTGCKSLGNDPQNCGTCGHACSVGLVCSSGACMVNCGANQVKCGVPDGGVADSGVHDSGGDDASHDASSHDASSHDAGSHDAGGGDAGQNPSGEYCADPDNDRLNCGACGNVCPYGPESTPVCTGGHCSITCQAGYADCDHNPDNGCEANTSTSPAACGGCGNVCDVPNSVPACVAGSCTVGSCLPGYADCDNKPNNGCEVNIDTPANCGSCGNACSLNNATPTCPTGTCAILHCNTGFADCDHNPANGCEISTSTDTNNCGGCGAVCNEANASSVCNGGVCGIGTCNAGFADCDNNPSDGCEINITDDPNNCSSCHAVCSLPNAIAGCASSQCTVVVCNGGFGNCDGIAANGCETVTSTNPSDCGSCGHVCSLPHANSGCAAGACTVGTCQTGYADCDGLPGDGCEIDTQTDPNNCGGCGHVCVTPNGVPGCSAGQCTVACNPGYANCNGLASDGCEVDTNTNDQNCGACNFNCAAECIGEVAATGCNNGACAISVCDSGWFDFDGQCVDGCECKASTTSTACVNSTGIFAGTLQPGQSTSYTSNMAPPGSVADAWLNITFGGNTQEAFHPKITFSLDTNTEFVFEVFSNCTGTLLSCGTEGTQGAGVTTWEESYTGTTGFAFGDEIYIPPPGTNGTVYIHVFRKAGATKTCNNYSLTVSD